MINHMLINIHIKKVKFTGNILDVVPPCVEVRTYLKSKHKIIKSKKHKLFGILSSQVDKIE